jgi:hypothetical protein
MPSIFTNIIKGGNKMKPYLITYSFYYNGKRERCYAHTELLDEPFHEIYTGDTFDGLWQLKKERPSMIPYDMLESKKGKRVLWHYDKLFTGCITPKNCKPWKLTITCAETTLSMNELMRFDTEKVIQYLKERGMAACPILK